MKCKLILLTILLCKINMFFSSSPKKVNIKESRINIEIDGSNKIGSFGEKVLYNLEINDNELKSVSFKKILPHIESKFFDVKVNSNDVKILRYEVKEEKNYNKNNKVLYVEFESLNKDKVNNFNQGAVNIEYQYKTKDTTNSVAHSFFLRDMELHEEKSENPYPTKFSVSIKNLPDNLKIKKVEFDNSEVGVNNKLRKNNGENNGEINLSFTKEFSGNNANARKLHFELETLTNNRIEKPASHSSNASSVKKNSSPAPSHSTSYNTTNSNFYSTSNNGNSKQSSHVYYTKKKNNHTEPNIWESIIAILLVVCLCYLCCQCYAGSSAEPAPNKEGGIHTNENVSPDGFVYYCN